MEERVDQRIARSIEDARSGIADQAREDVDRLLGLLALAFRDGRWGTFYASFPEPMIAARRLTDLAELIVPHLVRLAQGPRLVARLVQVVGDLSLVVAQGERTSAERDLAEARSAVSRLERLNELKSDSLRLVAHELRRPLTLLGGYASLLEGGELGDVPEQVRDILTQLVICNRELNRMVDLLRLGARYEDEADVLRADPLDVAALVEEVVAATAAQASARRIQVTQRVRKDLQLVADREHLRVALVNLLGNAVKYAPDGSRVVISAERREGEVALAVADQGKGLAPEEAARVFDRWYRTPREAREQVSGLGLGLYLVKRIADLHGGRVTLETAPGRGATFTMLLPAGGRP